VTKSIVKNKRALSPVIATVILVSVTIVVAVSVAYWMGSIAGGYTAFEQVELPTAYAKWDDNVAAGSVTGGWEISIELKNTGSADAAIDNIFLNGKPIWDYTFVEDTVTYYNLSITAPAGITDGQAFTIRIDKGSSAKITLQIVQETEGCSSGTRIDLKLHSAAGREYPAQVKLP